LFWISSLNKNKPHFWVDLEDFHHEIHEKHEKGKTLRKMEHKMLEICEQAETYEKVVYKEESYAIQGAIFEVYREMGCGFLEAVYQECLEKETGIIGEFWPLPKSNHRENRNINE
jgi:hypothetical protein